MGNPNFLGIAFLLTGAILAGNQSQLAFFAFFEAAPRTGVRECSRVMSRMGEIELCLRGRSSGAPPLFFNA